MATVTFALDTRKDSKAESFKIIARIRLGRRGTFAVYPIKDKKFRENQWDPIKQCLKGSSRLTQQVNIDLHNFKIMVSEAYMELQDRSLNGEVDIETFKYLLKHGSLPADMLQEDKGVELTLIDLIKQYVQANNFAVATLSIYDSTILHLESFAKAEGYSLDLNGFSLATYKAFMCWLVKPDGGGLINDTANKYLKKIKASIRWHVKENTEITGGQLSEELGEKLATIVSRMSLLQEKKKDQLAFRLEEVEILGSLDLSQDPRLEKVRDVSLFAAWTGIRASDLLGDSRNKRPPLLKANVSLQGQVLTYHAGKTKEINYTTVPLNEVTMNIVIKYQNCHHLYLLPIMSTQKANCYLKEIMKVLANFANWYSRQINPVWSAVQLYEEFEKVQRWLMLTPENWKIWAERCKTFSENVTAADMIDKHVRKQTFQRWEKLTFHGFRRFYITYLIESGASFEDVAKLVAHSDIKTTKGYDKSSNIKAVERVRQLVQSNSMKAA